MGSGKRKTIILHLIFILASALIVNSFLSYKNYTLQQDGKWLSTKAALRGLPGGCTNMITKIALSRNKLDLTTWFGYQELIYYQPLRAGAISFDYISRRSPFTFVIDRGDSLTSGICFNHDRDSISFLFIADRAGRFLHKKTFCLETSFDNDWSKATFKRTKDSVCLIVNGRVVLNTPFTSPDELHFGFRGGRQAVSVSVDNISAYDVDGHLLMQETFAPPFSLHWQTLLVILLLSIPVFVFINSPHASWVTAIHLSLTIGLAFAYCYYFFYTSTLMLSWDNTDWHGTKIMSEFPDTAGNRIDREFRTLKDKPIVLFIGSSQTWGAGATDSAMAYPCHVRDQLRAYFHDSAITVLNAGICALTSERLYDPYYTRGWYRYHPMLVVIDLSYNDVDTLVFRKYIRKFLELNRSNNIKTLLVEEPIDYVVDYIGVNHHIIKREGEQYNVEVVPMQSYMDTYHDSGFIWWDNVHMTDYGYEAFADALTPFIIREIEVDSSFMKCHIADTVHRVSIGRSDLP